MQTTKKTSWLKKFLMMLVGIGLFTSLYLWIKSLIKKRKGNIRKPIEKFKYAEQGLSDIEVEQRKTDTRIKARQLAEQREKALQRRKRIFSFFNITILVLAISQLFLQDIWGALGTLGALALSVSVSLFQQGRSARQVGKLLSQARPMATVIREGKLRNIDQDDIVLGDALVAGKGDEILANGEILEASNVLIDESLIKATGGVVSKKPGDEVFTGSYCDQGWAIYRADHFPDEVDSDELSTSATPISEIKTPLQKSIRMLLIVLLVIAGVFYGIILLEILRLDFFPSEILLMYRQVMSIIFSIAPAGLLFMIVVNYAVGSANIAESGALIRNSLAIESMAQITNLCIIRRGILDSVGVELEMLPAPSKALQLKESRARQLLGNYAHSITEVHYPMSIIKQSIEGERRPIDQKVRYLSLLGWEAMTFLSEDMIGTYVIGTPETLEDYIVREDNQESAPQKTISQSKRGSNRQSKVKNWLKRISKKRKEGPDSEPEDPQKIEMGAEQFTDQELAIATIEEFPEEKVSVISRVSRIFKRNKPPESIEEDSKREDENDELLRLLFAYSPEAQEINAHWQTPHPPKNLIPICYLIFVNEVRPDIQNAIEKLLGSGVSIKVFTTEAVEKALPIVRDLGIITENSPEDPFVEGLALSAFIDEYGEKGLLDKIIFSNLSTDQMRQVIQIFQDHGEHIAVLSNSISDIPLMSQSDLSISGQESSPKVLAHSDIILMDDSPDALPTVLKKGQSIVKSVIDMMKLNLTEIGYLLLLLILMFITGSRRFIYEPIQGGIIGIFSIVIPSAFISFWTTAIKVNRIRIRRQLARFFIPASLTIASFVITTFLFFHWRGYELVYIQHIMTHLLLTIKLLLVVFVQPPSRLFAINDEYQNDWRLTKVVALLFIVFQLLTVIPLAQRYLRLSPLNSLIHYLVIWGIAIAWAFTTRSIWRSGWFNRGKSQ